MTWGEAELITLQKVFAVSGSKVEINDTTAPYIAAMPHAANEALSLLATCGKYIVKSFEITTAYDNYRFKLTDKAADFYTLRDNEVFLNNTTCDLYTLIGGNEIVLNIAGEWRIYYNAYPPKITASTADNYELQLDSEAAVLLPLYMASQLYKDEDAEVATMYRNEFEAGREALLYRDVPKSGGMRFVSVNNWV
ncbi:MAG: hypothetical protein VB119_11340 [Candidatus Metalachnospira sp.]|nr:hypothetical protein [Candidatus Metalachnospira sp.]